MLVPSHPSRNRFLVIVVKNWHRSKSFLVLYHFAGFFQSVPNILFRVVDFSYFWDYIVSMSASIKTGIISAVGKKGHYI